MSILQRFFPAIITILVFVVLSAAASCSRQPRHAAPPISGNEVVLDIASLPQETPQFYTLAVGSKQVSFFVIRLQDAVYSYFDACVSCYRQKRGYRFEKGYVTCRACNMTYSIHALDKGIGGCYPIRLPGRTEGGNYRIPIAAIEAGQNKF